MDESDFDEFLSYLFGFLIDARSVIVPENVYVCLLASEGGGFGGEKRPARTRGSLISLPTYL